MIDIDEKNVWKYLTERMPELKGAEQVSVSLLDSEGNQSYGDGFLNYVYRVRYRAGQEDLSLIVKQARKRSRMIPIDLPTQRIFIERSAMKIRAGIAEEFMPGVLHFDPQNSVMVLEDLMYMECLRFSLSGGQMYRSMAHDLGRFMAYNHFFTSDFYLDNRTFRAMECSFQNPEMRELLANAVFFVGDLDSTEEEQERRRMRMVGCERLAGVVALLKADEEFMAECAELQSIYRHKNQCLIHGDLHTSNVFAKDGCLKVIDMEETTVGPYAFDLGYFMANLVSQFCAAPFKAETKNQRFMGFIIESAEEVFNTYCSLFDELCNEYGTKAIAGNRAYKDKLFKEILSETAGFSAVSLMSRVGHMVDFPEFDHILSDGEREKAKLLAMAVGSSSLIKRREFNTIRDFTENVVMTVRKFI